MFRSRLVPAVAAVGILLLAVVGVLWLVFTILGSVRTADGGEYRYPLTIRMVS